MNRSRRTVAPLLLALGLDRAVLPAHDARLDRLHGRRLLQLRAARAHLALVDHLALGTRALKLTGVGIRNETDRMRLGRAAGIAGGSSAITAPAP